MSEAKRVVTREENPVAYNCGCRYMGDEGRCFGCVAAIREAGIAEGRRMEREAIVAWCDEYLRRLNNTASVDDAEYAGALELAGSIKLGEHMAAQVVDEGEHEKGSVE